MTRIKALGDEFDVIREASRSLPSEELKVAFLEAVAELEDNEAHRTHAFPKTRFHRIRGIKQEIYRADVTKTSGWRIHAQYSKAGTIELRDLVPGDEHDQVVQVVKAKKHRYE